MLLLYQDATIEQVLLTPRSEVFPKPGAWLMPDDVTQLLSAIADGNDSAINRLLPLVYNELRRLAEAFLVKERSDHTLQATALVHEAYLKLVDQTRARWQDRAHFFAVASQAMRRILVDHARSREREKRGGGAARVSLESDLFVAYDQSVDLIALDEALTRLATVRPRSLKVVELRYFGGLTIEEAASVLGCSDTIIEREWRFARAWLYCELDPKEAGFPE
ncbi:MAG TPA: sigma-70 family RNA polymerase sigma factor [Phycisphaerae bacterium]|nr:sigma-70 family RNA polymerase sigma factor [Phycisphaerae bacterium]